MYCTLNFKLIPREAILGGRENWKQYKGPQKTVGSDGFADVHRGPH